MKGIRRLPYRKVMRKKSDSTCLLHNGCFLILFDQKHFGYDLSDGNTGIHRDEGLHPAFYILLAEVGQISAKGRR